MHHPLLHIADDGALLESLAKEYGTPLYIYSASRIKENLDRFQSALNAFEKNHICYAIKANNNPHLVSFMKKEHPALGADCSSPGELYVARTAGMAGNECIFSGNYESSEDLQSALDSSSCINLDDITSFSRLINLGLPELLSFRINPGFGKGTFSQITTAGENAKFGIPAEKIVNAYINAQNAGIQKFGLQCMAGSGNLDGDYFIELLTAIIHNTKKIESELGIHFEFVSMGGGWGIP